MLHHRLSDKLGLHPAAMCTLHATSLPGIHLRNLGFELPACACMIQLLYIAHLCSLWPPCITLMKGVSAGVRV